MPPRVKICIATVLSAVAVCLAGAAIGWVGALHYAVHCLALAGLLWATPSGGNSRYSAVWSAAALLTGLEFGYLAAVAPIVAAAALRARGSRPGAQRVLLENAGRCAAVLLAVRGWLILPRSLGPFPTGPAFAATTYFLVIALAGMVVSSILETAPDQRKSLRRRIRECGVELSAGAAAAAVAMCASRWGWPAICLPLLLVSFGCWRGLRYLEALKSAKKDAEHRATIHLRTVEAMALAIEAKDDLSADHLRRLQVYAWELGKRAGLAGSSLEALRAASILHDIGKLAIPEHILSKPGKLTPEEFDKMKIHPVVGAEILLRVQFPYPVAPMVRSHHEKWDGSGYPDGLKGEQIPLGARVLAVIDCLDALVSDRPYRSALPLAEAMAVIRKEAGASFDPKLVELLHTHYQDWERLANNDGTGARLFDVRLPVASASADPLRDFGPRPEYLSSIAAARVEAQTVYELTQDLGNSLNLRETLTVMSSRLQRLIPYDAIAVYVLGDGSLRPEYAAGESSRLFGSLEIPLGQGLSGWVAETGKPIVNGNPSVEPGYLNDSGMFNGLRSALAAPLENSTGVIGVLALYSVRRDAFTRDHLRILLGINPKVALAIENALKFRHAAISATTDGLTSLPNARSLFLHLESELARARRTGGSLAVLVCDLDGFKQVNDRFGHLEGNRILKLVAAGMRDCCREYDYVARMGGDEFVIVLPGLGPGDLREKVKALQRVVIAAGTAVCGERLLNLSVGAAFFPEQALDPEGLLAEADRQMYLVKQSHKSEAADLAEELAALATSVNAAEPTQEDDGQERPGRRNADDPKDA